MSGCPFLSWRFHPSPGARPAWALLVARTSACCGAELGLGREQERGVEWAHPQAKDWEEGMEAASGGRGDPLATLGALALEQLQD